jgi:hypothetical protein
MDIHKLTLLKNSKRFPAPDNIIFSHGTIGSQIFSGIDKYIAEIMEKFAVRALFF